MGLLDNIEKLITEGEEWDTYMPIVDQARKEIRNLGKDKRGSSLSTPVGDWAEYWTDEQLTKSMEILNNTLEELKGMGLEFSLDKKHWQKDSEVYEKVDNLKGQIAVNVNEIPRAMRDIQNEIDVRGGKGEEVFKQRKMRAGQAAWMNQQSQRNKQSGNPFRSPSA